MVLLLAGLRYIGSRLAMSKRWRGKRKKCEPSALEQALGQQAGLASSQESSSVDRQSG